MVRAALESYDGKVMLATVTAPGADVLPWDGQVVELDAANAWNSTAQRRFSELHRRAQQATRRAGHARFSRLTYTWQLQRRGALHVHAVLPWSIRDRAGTKCYLEHLRRLGPEWGFGFIDARDIDGKAGRATVMEGWRAATYTTRYLLTSDQFLGALRLSARPRRLVYVNPTLTAKTGVTMRRLRRVRYLHVLRSFPAGSVVARAGGLPAWFRDQGELATVQGLLVAAPNAP